MATKSGGNESKNKITVGVVAKSNLLSSKRLFVFAIGALLILVVAAILIVSLTHDKLSVTGQLRSTAKPQGPLGVIPGSPLTKEQKREMTAVKRVDGVISSADAKNVTLALGDGSKLKLNIQTNTAYSSGSHGYPAQSSVVMVNHKAVLTYDSLGNKLKSIWVDYDK
jgi:hypothetical protein